MSSTELMWFKIIVIFVAMATIALSIVNLVYYNRIRNGTCVVSHSEAVTMFWLNFILMILAIIVFLWTLWKLIMPEKHLTTKVGMIHTVPTVQTVAPVPVQTAVPSHTIYTHPDGSQSIVAHHNGAVTTVATSTAPSANVVVPNESSVITQQQAYY